MSLPRLKPVLQQAIACLLALSMPTLGLAQEATPPAAPSAAKAQQYQRVDYSKPNSHFPNPLAPYMARQVATPNLANTARIENLLRDGKIYLSMDDAIALALENNLDIAIARYNLNIADTDVLRAKAGSSILGVNTGVVQNTPGGGIGGLGGQVGSGTGGTSAGSGGAGTGTGGLVVSTLGSGPNITSFDPVLSSTLQFDHSNSKASSAFIGVPVLSQNTQTFDFAYQQGFQTGTNLSVGFNNTRATTNSPFTSLSPELSSGFKATISQHLLQGFGFAPNRRFIRIAKNNREISDVAFRLQIITTVNQIQSMYWDLVYAYEFVRVQQESLAFAQKTLDDTKKQVEIGTLAPIEVVRAQSTVATDQQSLTVAQTNLQLQQLLMKNALTRSLQDPKLADAEVIPTSTAKLPEQEPVTPTQELVNDALAHRPELAIARINMTNNEISNKAVRSSLLPTLDAFAYYGGTGLGGTQNPASTCAANPSNPFCTNDSIPTVGYGSTLNQLIDSSAPDKGVGLTLNIPLRNRSAQATQIRSQLEYRQAQIRLQQIENQVRIEVRNAQFAVLQNRASVQSAQAAVDLARQSLDAEQKKYALGASTSTLVLQNQSTLAMAESTLVSAMAAYLKSRLELDRSAGQSLERAGIIMDDAARGEVTHSPAVPYVTARPDPQSVAAPPQQ
ncbi:MAG: TolC family protein [Acidobacteria bacterium]|nr:TolC family protein [Acidobacteriota bacterium]